MPTLFTQTFTCTYKALEIEEGLIAIGQDFKKCRKDAKKRQSVTAEKASTFQTPHTTYRISVPLLRLCGKIAS
jgi:hypothetical protein